MREKAVRLLGLHAHYVCGFCYVAKEIIVDIWIVSGVHYIRQRRSMCITDIDLFFLLSVYIYFFPPVYQSDDGGASSAHFTPLSMIEHSAESNTGNTHQTSTEQISSHYHEHGHTFGGRPPLVFSHLEHTSVAEDATGCGPVPFQSGMELGQHQCLSCSCRTQKETTRGREGEVYGDGCDQDGHLLTQLQSLTVSPHEEGSASIGRMSDNGVAPQLYGPDCLHRETESEGGACGGQAQWAWSRCCHGNCRNAALGVGSSYVDDDVTVDDLAGYFDQMLHLPRPMSDMAQLMYT